MKTLKPRLIILFLVFLLLNSCVVKSLHPFYTKSTIFFEKRFIGTWDDNKNNKCEVFSFKEKFLEGSKKQTVSELSKKDFEEYNRYKDGYFVKMIEGDKEAYFFAMPFKINNTLFLDFSIIDVNMDAINRLANSHLVGMHSLAKLEFSEDFSMVNLKYFSEKKLKELFDEDKIKIKYEKTGHNDSGILLTSSSEELQKFIKKYMDSSDEDKWATDIEYDLKKQNGHY